MTESTTEIERGFELGDWAVIADESSMRKTDRQLCPAGTKVLVTGPAPDTDGRIAVSRPGQNTSGAVTVYIRPDGLTDDLTRRSPGDERAAQKLVTDIKRWTGSLINRAAALEILDAVDAARAEVSS